MIAIIITLIALLDPVHGQFLEELYQKYKNLVYSIAYSMLHHTHDAEEIVQNVFLKAYFNRHTLEHKSHADIVLWLKLCTRHRTIDFLRKKKSDIALTPFYEDDTDETKASELADFSAIPETICIDREQRMFILAKINKLPEEQRTAIICRYYFDMRSREIAGILGRTESSVNTMIYRAKKTLEKELGEMIHD